MLQRDRMLPGRAWSAFFLFGLAALAVLSIDGVGDGLDGFVAFLLIFVVYPLLLRRFGRPTLFPPRFRTAPRRVWRRAAVVGVVLLAAIFALPKWGLGAPFWFWLAVAPALRLFESDADRDLRVNGVESWPRETPIGVRRVLASAVAVALFIGVVAATDGDSGTLVIRDGFGCGAVILVFSTVLAIGQRRSLRRAGLL